MYPANFDYKRASSVAEAVQLLGQHDNAKLIAGGHSLLPMMKLRLATPAMLIDISRVDDMKGIRSEDDRVWIGALTTHAEIAASDMVPGALRDAAEHVGDPQVRNRGTIGGNIAHADPASDLPTALVAIGASFHVQGPDGERRLDAAGCFIDMFTTSVGPGEVLTGISLPSPAPRSGSAYAKLEHPASRYALVGAAAAVTLHGNQVTACRVAIGGLTPTATLASSVASALTGRQADSENISSAAALVEGDCGDLILGDMHAVQEYRLAMAPIFVRRALEAAAARAR